jgi:hypothetical protein
MDIAASWWDDAYEASTAEPMSVQSFEVDARVQRASRVVLIVGEPASTQVVGDTAIVCLPDGKLSGPTDGGVLQTLNDVSVVDTTRHVDCCLYTEAHVDRACPMPKTFQWHTGTGAFVLSHVATGRKRGVLVCTACARSLLASLGHANSKASVPSPHTFFYA